jgi:hypothetical protein
MGFTFSFSHFLILAFLLVLLIALVYSAVLIYHWREYGESKAIITTTTTVYLIGVACCLAGMAVAILMTF